MMKIWIQKKWASYIIKKEIYIFLFYFFIFIKYYNKYLEAIYKIRDVLNTIMMSIKTLDFSKN